MSKNSISQGSASQTVRRLRQAKRRVLALAVDLVANGVMSRVTLENASATGLGLCGGLLNSLPGLMSLDVQIVLPNERTLAATVCWVGAGRIGVKLAARLAQDDPLLQSDQATEVVKPANTGSGVVSRFAHAANPDAGRRILVVNGLRSIGYLMKGILEKAGNHVDVVEDGAAMVEAARQKVYDVVLIDSSIAPLDGTPTALRIRELPGPFGQSSIIAVAEAGGEIAAAAFDAILVRPIRPAALLEQVAAVRARRESGMVQTTRSRRIRANAA